MASPKRKTVSRKAPSKRRVAHQPSFFSSSLFFKMIVGFGFLVFLYSQRNVVSRYLGFTTDKIVFSEARSMPVDKVLEAHIEKSFGIDISEYQHLIGIR